MDSFKLDVDENLSKVSSPGELFLAGPGVGARQLRKIGSYDNMNDTTFGTQNQSMLPNASTGDNSLGIIKVFPVITGRTPSSEQERRQSDSNKLSALTKSVVSDSENITAGRLSAPKEGVQKSRFYGASDRIVSSGFKKSKTHLTSGSENDAEGYDGLEERPDSNHIVRSLRKQQTMNPLQPGIEKEGRRNNFHSVKGKPPSRSLTQVIAKYDPADMDH